MHDSFSRAARPGSRNCSIRHFGVQRRQPADLAERDILFNLLADPDGAVADVFGLDTGEGYTDRRTFVLADEEVFAMYDPKLADPSRPCHSSVERHTEWIYHRWIGFITSKL